MRPSRTIPPLAALLLGAAAACAGSVTPHPQAPPPPAAPAPTAAPSPAASVAPDPLLVGPDEAALERTAPPCDDFYQFACGGWMKATPIPEDEASWVRSFSVIHEDNQKALRAILERDARGETQGDPYGVALGDFWKSCTDEPGIEKRGVDELRSELKRIASVSDSRSLIQEIARLHSKGVGAAFGFDSEVDFRDAAHMIAGLSQGGLGLPERDYYFRDDQRTKDIRTEYLGHVARTLRLLGASPKDADGDAKVVLKFETDLAGASMTNVQLRDPQNIYHKIDLAGLKALAPDISWDAYLDKIGFPAITAINVSQPDFVKKLDALVKTGSFGEWRTYLRWQLGQAASPFLSQKFVDEWFRFRKILTGAKELQPRWKRCVRFADQMMGEALAQPFVKEYLGDDGKRTAEQMVRGIEESMKADI